ncbi:HAD-IIIC family phosphatase [Paenibacillus donghaensis]|nr:HAD-IIIC family phosphatase [Paenibacillus donghaensis]
MSEEQAVKRILISATFTANPVLKTLDSWQKKLQLSYTSEVLAYNQVFQEWLHAESALRSNQAGLNVVMLRWEDWLPYQDETAVDYASMKPENEQFQKMRETLAATAADAVQALRAFATGSSCQTLLMICPSSQAYESQAHWRSCFAELEQQLQDQADQSELIHIIRAQAYHDSYRIEVIDDPARNKLGHIPFVDKYYDFLGTLLVRYYYSLQSKPYKVIVADCDHTLWSGVCGESAFQKLAVQGATLELQHFLVRQKEQGMLLCLCSKNNEEDVWHVFDNRRDFPLKRLDLTDSRINWQLKSDNLRSLAESLNVGLDSFIFIDDNPVECAEVQARCPEVLTLQWPAEEEERLELLRHTWAFDHFNVTAEDARRTVMTQQNLQRKSLLEESADFQTFLQKLDLRVDIVDMENKHLSRVSQLTKRTNQFNFTTIRRSQKEIQLLLDKEGYTCKVVHVRDRFGDYGLVGMILYKLEEDSLKVDTFILSCRVLGRGVEHQIMRTLGELALEKGLSYVDVRYVETNKNKPVSDFIAFVLKAIPEQSQVNQPESGAEYRLGAASLKKITLDLRKEDSRSLDQPASPVPPLQATYPYILEEIKELVGSILSVEAGSIDANIGLENYMNDSFKVVELTAALQNRYPNVSATFLYEYSSLAEIAGALSSAEEQPAAASEGTEKEDVRVSADDLHNFKDNSGNSEHTGDEPYEVAIVGINGRFPQADSMAEFWENLLKGVPCITEIPPDRWNTDLYYDPNGESADKSHSKWGGFIQNVDSFDHAFFGISPREAECMDPQQRIFLEVVWGLLEDACYTRKSLDANTGVFVGVISNDYSLYASEAALHGFSAYRGAELYQIPNRVSYFMNFIGPSMAVDTACSSSGTAIHLAYESMRRGECRSAIVGGVNLFLHPGRYIQYSQMQMLSRDKECCPFGANAAGTIFGEGIGALLLKPLQQAQLDQDRIYAVIKGTAVNSGGKTNGFTVPNPNAQAELIAAALNNACIPASTVSYIEAHGTGTPLGDPIEVRGLTKAFEQCKADHEASVASGSCALGSVKSNIGHLESGAAIAGIIKILLQMKHKTIVPSLNSSLLNPLIPFASSPFYVPQKAEEWRRPVWMDANGISRPAPRRAGISSFGAGGSNAHIILEEYEHTEVLLTKEQRVPIVVLSAKNEIALQMMAERLRAFIENEGLQEAELAALAYSLQVGREQFKYRAAFIFDSLQELCNQLEDFAEGRTGSGKIVTGVVQSSLSGQLLFGEREADQAFLQSLLKDREYARIAMLWVMGADIYWPCLYMHRRPQRMSLPGYPFAKTRHWLPAQHELVKGGHTATLLQPLLHRIDSRKTAKLGTGLVFETTLVPWHSLIQSSSMSGKPVLPAAAYIEMVRAAMDEAAGAADIVIENIDLLEPLTVEVQTRVYLSLSAVDEHQYVFCIQSDGEDPKLYSKGTVRADEGRAAFFDISAIVEDRLSQVDPETFYSACAKSEVHLDEMQRQVTRLWDNGRDLLAELRMKESELGRGYGIHPAMLECALQLQAYCSEENDEIAGMKEVRIAGKTPAAAYAYIQRDEHGGRKQASLLNPAGEVIVHIGQLLTRRQKKAWDELMYVPVWEELERLPVRKDIPQTVLIVDSESSASLSETLNEYYSNKFPKPQMIHIRLSELTEQLQDRENSWSCGIHDINGFEVCLRQYASIDCLYSLSDCRSYAATVDIEDLIQSQSANEVQLLRLIKALRQKETDGKRIATFIITQDNCRITDSAINPYGGGVTGLTYSIAHGDYRFSVRNIDISAEDLATEEKRSTLLENIVNEEASDRGDVVKLHSGRRYKQSFIKLDTERFKQTQGLQKNGVYVILGGSGLVGGIMTRYLMQNYQAKVVWIGRSPESSPAVQEKLDSFAALGEPPLYVQADATSLEQLQQAVARIKRHYPNINGAIFSGIVISFENSVAQTTEREFKDILDVKSQGSIHFYKAFEREKLDFLCYFSSGQAFSFSGAATLSAYASGITFADTFVRYMRPKAAFPIGIINWGFWMPAELNPSLSKNIGFIEPFEGFSCFEQFTAMLRMDTVRQVICLKATEPVLELMKCKESETVSALERYSRPEVGTLWNQEIVMEDQLPELYAINDQEELQLWMVKLLYVQMQEMGFFNRKGIRIETQALRKVTGTLDKFDRMVDECLGLLEAKGFIRREGNAVIATEQPQLRDGAGVWSMWETAKDVYLRDANWQTKVRLVDACLRKLPDILRGTVMATDVLFPESSMKMLEGVYKGNALSDYFNNVVANIIVEYVRRRVQTDPLTKVKIIEVGAGTGGTSAMVFAKLKPYSEYVEYCYTDISKAFLLFAKEKYGPDNPYIQFKLNNIEKPLADQNIKAGSYDIAIATNCLHATKNMNRTMRNMKAVLKAGGLLLLNEDTDKMIFTTLTFGLLDGWWLYEDEHLRIPGAPLLYPETWKAVLEEEGFCDVGFPASAARGLGQQIIAAESNGVIRQPITGKTLSPQNESASSQEKKGSADPSIKMKQQLTAAGERKLKAEAVTSAAGSAGESLESYVKSVILDKLSKSLKVTVDSIDTAAAFSDYGVDSIIGIMFVKQTGEGLGIQLNSAILFDYPTVDRLSRFIIKNYKDQLQANVKLPVKPAALSSPNPDDFLDLLKEQFFADDISIDSLIQKIRQ